LSKILKSRAALQFFAAHAPLQTLMDYLEGGETLDEFLDDLPTVSRVQAVGALQKIGRN